MCVVPGQSAFAQNTCVVLNELVQKQVANSQIGEAERMLTAALASAGLLALFATAMTISLGFKPPLDYSVFSASAGALLLALRARKPL